MNRKEKIHKIIEIINTPLDERPQIDYSKWSDEDLRIVVAMGEKYPGLKNVEPADREILEQLVLKYNQQ